MNKLSKLFVFFIITLALISSCTTTKEVDDGILRVNGHVVSFDLDGGKNVKRRRRDYSSS